MASKCKKRRTLRQEVLLGSHFNNSGKIHLFGGRHGDEEEGTKS